MRTPIRSRAVGVGAALALSAALGGAALVQPGAAQAASITIVTGAGVTPTDPTWTVTPPAGVATAATVITSAPGGWTGTITGADWIGTAAVTAPEPAGAYVFQSPVTSPDASSLTGSVLSPDPVALALVQGTTVTPIPGTFGGSATTPTPVTFAGPIASGNYVIRATVTHTDAAQPVGFAASFTLDDGATEPEATQFYALAIPVRVYDSRTGTGPASNGAGPIVSGTTRTISLRQGYDSPAATTRVGAVPADAVSALVNVTIDGTTTTGFLTVYSSAVAQPASSSINWSAPNQILANMSVVAVPADGTIKITAGGGGSTQLVVDVLGFYR